MFARGENIRLSAPIQFWPPRVGSARGGGRRMTAMALASSSEMGAGWPCCDSKASFWAIQDLRAAQSTRGTGAVVGVEFDIVGC